MPRHDPPRGIPGERWKPARAGFPAYVVSDAGRVFNAERGALLRPYVNDADGGSPYLRVNLCNGSFSRGPRRGQPRRAALYVHRLVALAFVPGRSADRWQVHHINGDTLDARAVNLAFVTGAENLELRGTDPERFAELLAGYRRAWSNDSAGDGSTGASAGGDPLADAWPAICARSAERDRAAPFLLYPVEPDPF